MENKSVESEILNKNQSWFKFCAGIDEKISLALNSITIDNDDQRGILFCTFFGKAINSYYAALKLLRSGYGQDAGIVLRSIIESLFICKACHDDNDFFESFLKSDLFVKEHALKRYLLYASRKKLEDESAQHVDEYVKIKENIQREGSMKVDFSVAAKKAGLDDYYDIVYVNLSIFFAHPTLRSLDKRLSTDGKGSIKEIKVGPDIDDVEWILHLLIEPMLLILNCMSVEFSLGMEDVLSRTLLELKNESEQYMKRTSSM